MRIVCISDTHEGHRQVHIPECDVLVHSGDTVTDFYKLGSRKIDEFEDFLEWFDAQPARHKIFIAGNHDFGLYYDRFNIRDYFLKAIPKGVTYLQDEEVIIDGVKFYGTPWQPDFMSYAFNIADHDERLAKMELIPDDVSVLLTHMPPKTIRDRLRMSREEREFSKSKKMHKHVGCGALSKQLPRLKSLRLHVFGHIHHTYGVSTVKEVVHVNAALCGEIPYTITNEPIVVDFLESGVLVS